MSSSAFWAAAAVAMAIATDVALIAIARDTNAIAAGFGAGEDAGPVLVAGGV